MRIHLLTAVFFILVAERSPLAAEDATAGFLVHCQEIGRCQDEIALLLEGDPSVSGEY